MQFKSIKPLIFSSILYLLLPNLLFYYNWFRNPIGILLVIIMIVNFVLYFRAKNFIAFPDFEITKKQIIILLFLSLIWTILTGVGNVVYQFIDFPAHNAKLYEMYKNQWPIKYEHNNLEIIYYWAFYLIPALIMKPLGHFSELVYFLYFYVGMLICSSWIFVLFKNNYRKILLFLFAGSFGVFVNQYIFSQLFDFPQHVWPIFVSSVFEESNWVPNQIIPVVIVGSYFLYLIKEKLDFSHILLPFIFIFTWCVFPVIAFSLIFLIAFLIYGNITKFIGFSVHFLKYYMIVLIPVMLYYQSSNGGQVFEFILIGDLTLKKVFLYTGQLLPQVILMVFFTFMFIKESKERKFTLAIIATLCVIGLFKIGVFNELVSRSYMVFYFFVYFMIVKNLTIQHIRKFSFIYIILILDVFTSVKIVKEKVTNSRFYSLDNLPIYDSLEYKSIYDFFIRNNRIEEMKQYSSKSNSLYIKYLRKEK